jgi:hypothetical protein
MAFLRAAAAGILLLLLAAPAARAQTSPAPGGASWRSLGGRGSQSCASFCTRTFGGDAERHRSCLLQCRASTTYTGTAYLSGRSRVRDECERMLVVPADRAACRGRGVRGSSDVGYR